MPRKLSLPAARRLAVASAGLAAPRPKKPGPAAMSKVIAALGVLQLDSVNVFERSHYLPLFARLGLYDRAQLDRLVGHDGRTSLGAYTEYMAHEAAIIPVADWPLWQWHRDLPERPRTQEWMAAQATLFDEVRAEFSRRGALRISDLEHPGNVSRGGGWWNKNEVHWVANHLFRSGQLVVVGRDRFERILAPADQQLPPESRLGIPREEALAELIRRAARVYGVATLDDLADYPRVKLGTARPIVEHLVETGELEPVEVDGWGKPAYLRAGATIPRAVTGVALLSPFDPLVWYRARAERLFDFYYRISIYTPAAKREHGYYVLPVLIDGELVGRVDLKSDRKAGVLRVQHAHVEPAHASRASELAGRLVPTLREAAQWQGLSDVSLTGPGTWAPALQHALT